MLHKDSKWYQQWKDFKDNNVVFNSEDFLFSSAFFWGGGGGGCTVICSKEAKLF